MFGCVTHHQPEVQSPEKNTIIDHCVPVSKAARTHVKNLEKLLHKGLYFKFDTYYLSCRERLPEKYRLYFDIFHCDLFGYPEFLEVQDQILLKRYYNELTESEKIEYHLIKISHYQKKYQYKNVFSEVLKLKRFAEKLNPNEKKDFQQYYSKFSVLQDIPPMKVWMHGNDSIQLSKPGAHLHIPLSINGNMINLVFDTGAGKSLISKSLAEKFGLILLETNTYITGTTGARAKTNLGVAETVGIGNAVYEHVVFEVMEDSLLGVPAYNFFFDGLVGLDLLYPLGSITLNACGTLMVNADANHYIRNNLAICNYDNRILLSCQDDTIPVKFDTGAFMSIFNRHFYELYYPIIRENGKEIQVEYGGIGGGRSVFNMVRLESMAFAVYNDSFKLRNIRIHTEFIHEDTVTYFGLLGQDILRHFNEITMNFNPNSIEYRNKD
jgi:hypothetical protein